ncbi:hypothetical protein K7X08_001228 [Anisodus acutangulus]|uniref:H15 domain-containing protein n=1 Tax=Anisodus acutangulus TaxID=402998 RepID=A0A9Q1MP05_9SOLA|nr:hypothetical protein K7X08_001228 [Anisodus acutangulus]
MDLSTLQSTSENPNFPTYNVQKQKQKNQEKAMDKLREAILELANSEPNVPLSAIQNSVLQQQLNHFLSCLHTAPDHPPYTWMIEQALQELGEEGGSSEDSISKFIKKEYDSLPWAHTTLLKHHLQKMSEKGEVLMIGGRFLLPGDSENLNPKRKRKRKRRRDWEIKQKKPQKLQKEEKRVQHDGVEVVKEQKKFDEQQNEVTINGKHGQENQIREEYGELTGHLNEPSTYKEDGQLSGQKNNVTRNKVRRKKVQRIRVVHKQKGKQQLEATEEIEHLEDPELQQPKLILSRVEETADISNLRPREILENEQPGENLPQILSPEAPPGFEFMAVEEGAAANKVLKSSSVGLDSPKEDHVVHQSSERHAEDQAPRMDDLSGALKQSRESPKQQSVDTERLEEESVAEDLLKTKKQDTERLEEESVAEDLLKTKKQDTERLEDKSVAEDLLKTKKQNTERLEEESVAEDLLKTKKQDTERLEEESVAEDLLKTKKQDTERLEDESVAEDLLKTKKQDTERLEEESVAEDLLKTKKQDTERLEDESVAEDLLKTKKQNTERLEEESVAEDLLKTKKQDTERLEEESVAEDLLKTKKQDTERLEDESVAEDLLKTKKQNTERLEEESVSEDLLKTKKQDTERLEEESVAEDLLKTKKQDTERLEDESLAEDLLKTKKQDTERLEEGSVAEDLLKTKKQDTERLEEESVAEDLLKTKNQDTERLVDESLAEDLFKTKKQQKKHHSTHQTNRPTQSLSRAQRKGTVTPNAPIVMALQCQQQERQVELAMESSSEPKQQSFPRKMTRTQLKRIIGSEPAASTDLFALKHLEQENSPETKQQVGKLCLNKKIGAQQQEQHISEPNQLAIRRKRTRTQQIGIVTQPPSSTDLFASEHLEQENLSETKQQVDKLCGLSEKTGALPNEMIIPDVQGNCYKREAQQLTELSKMEGSHEIVLATVEPSSEKKKQPEEGRSTLKKLNVDDKPDVLLLQSPPGFEAASIEKSFQTDRAQRQLKRWSKNPGEPKSVSTSKVEPLPFCASADQHSVQMEEPLSTSKVDPLPLCASADQHFVHMEEPLEVLNSTNPQHEVNLEQPKKQPRVRRPRYKEDGAKPDNSTISALATNEEMLSLDDPQDEVHLKQQKNKCRRRTPKGKEDEADLDSTILKDLVGLSKKQNGRGLGRRRKAQ